MRTKLLITGAAGGMGRACARLIGVTHDLVLADVAAPVLEAFAEELRSDGFTIAATHAGDLGDPAVLDAIVADLGGGAPFAVIHTAGISPSMAGWEPIMTVNHVATEKLLRAIEPHLVRGSVVAMIASLAAHSAVPFPDAAPVLAEPLASDYIERVGAVIEAAVAATGAPAPVLAYILSKMAVMKIAERRARAWGEKGARIVSISPGMIMTPMGRVEMEKTAGFKELGEAAPAGRLGTPLDIALAARFLISEDAAFVTGCDLLVDGGSVGSRK